MDSERFDRLVAAAARRPTRRAALRLLAGGLLGGIVSLRGAAARAQRADSDQDGLFDDDETDVYGTDPFDFDTDGDGDGDGLEVYNGTDPLAIVCAPGGTLCFGQCRDLLNDNFNCGGCGAVCPNFAQTYCQGGTCFQVGGGVTRPAPGTGAAPAACFVPGTPCDFDGQGLCCAGSVCCFDGISLRPECRDVTGSGGVCPN